MRLVVINEAEAIIEPFWDGGSSENPTDKISLLDEYVVTVCEGTTSNVKQTWCCVKIYIERAKRGNAAVVMERACDIGLEGYDILRIFASMPQNVYMTVCGCIDGEPFTILDTISGINNNDEIDGKVKGKRLTSLRIELALHDMKPASVQLYWIGLANCEAQKRMEARKTAYTSDWPGMLLSKPERLEPEIGLFFDRDELDHMRQNIRKGHTGIVFSKLREQAQEDMKLDPEAEIGEYVPDPDPQWCRKRDAHKTHTARVMQRLAFVGLLDGNAEMSAMAARMALSAAHCQYWCTSIMGQFPGATWHHRSFTEESYSGACALVLDWAGFCITPHGKQVIRDAIIMKGLPRIESDFKRMEYIRNVNQGIIFSSGRIIGLLSLLPVYPRYRSLAEEAERDLLEMIDAYILDDGGTPEGMSYWNFTFSQAMPLIYMLARNKNMEIEEYASVKLKKTGDFYLGMLSITGNGCTYLPVNDAHSKSTSRPGLAAIYYRISKNPLWKKVLRLILESETYNPNIFDFILMENMTVETKTANEYEPTVHKFNVFPDAGQVSTVRLHPRVGSVHFHLCSGPTCVCHYHEDKGSFIIETAGEILALDRGVADYNNPESFPMRYARYHNLLYPENESGGGFHQPVDCLGGRLGTAMEKRGAVLLACDNAKAWETGLFATNIRRVFSPNAGLFIFDDEIRIREPLRMSFRLNTHFLAKEKNGELWVKGIKSSLRIYPLNWKYVGSSMAFEGIDDQLEPVRILKMITEQSAEHRLLTAVEVVPNDSADSDLWNVKHGANALMLSRGNEKISLIVHRDRMLEVAVHKDGQLVLAAESHEIVWNIRREYV